MDLVETDITDLVHSLAESLGAEPIGWCAVASVALWTTWNAWMEEQLVFCIAFDGPVAHHVYLRRGNLLLDPSGHQFETHMEHCYTASQETNLYAHHRCAMQTSCPDEFMDMLGQVGWPSHQWPTPSKVGSLVRAMQMQGLVPGTLEHVED